MSARKRIRRLNLGGHEAEGGAAQGDINVTPLVDVVLVLLIIFMVVTPLLEKNLPVRTPNSEKVEQPTEVPPDQLVVYVDKAGALRINSDSVAASELTAKLRTKLDLRAAADRVVFIVADDLLGYSRLITVLDATKQAGAEVLGFATEPSEPEATR
jgi:biopolymer transport protein ExbD